MWNRAVWRLYHIKSIWDVQGVRANLNNASKIPAAPPKTARPQCKHRRPQAAGVRFLPLFCPKRLTAPPAAVILAGNKTARRAETTREGAAVNVPSLWHDDVHVQFAAAACACFPVRDFRRVIQGHFKAGRRRRPAFLFCPAPFSKRACGFAAAQPPCPHHQGRKPAMQTGPACKQPGVRMCARRPLCPIARPAWAAASQTPKTQE